MQDEQKCNEPPMQTLLEPCHAFFIRKDGTSDEAFRTLQGRLKSNSNLRKGSFCMYHHKSMTVKADTHEGFCSRSMLQDDFARVSTHEGALFAPGACSQVFNRLNIVEHFAGWKFCSRG